MQRKELLEEEFQTATEIAVKMVIQDKLKEAEREINEWKGELKDRESRVNQHETRMQQLVTTKKVEGLFRT